MAGFKTFSWTDLVLLAIHTTLYFTA